MRICLAGGLGFIGHHVAVNLLQQGHECIILDCQEDYGKIEKNEISQIYEERNSLVSAATIINTDISKLNHLPLVDVIVNLAGYPRAKLVDINPSRASECIHVGTIRLCEIAKKYSAKMIFVSSSMVYGNWIEPVAKESHVVNPIGLYAIMKLQAEQLVKEICSTNHVIIRPSAVYGPRDITDRVVSLMFKSAMNGQPILVEGDDNKLDFTYVDDIANGIVAVVNSKEKNLTVNMSNGNARSLLELATLIKELTNSNSIIHVTKHNERYPKRGAQDITEAMKLFAFHPKVSLEEGLQRYYQWLTTNSLGRTSQNSSGAH